MTHPDPFDVAWQRHQGGDRRGAEEAYRKLLQTDPRNARVWLALGMLCLDEGRSAEAAADFRQVAELQPKEPQGHLYLGNALLNLKRWAEAEPAFRACLELQPKNVDALVNLGYVLGELERSDEAVPLYEQALALNPAVPEAHHNLGNLLREKGRLDEALARYAEALRQRPDYPKALVNQAIALTSVCDVAGAIAALERAIALQPDFAEAHNTLGHALSAAGRLDEAEAAFHLAADLKADYPDPRWNLSLLWLLRGDYARGWPAVEWRWKCRQNSPVPAVTCPKWDGSPLDGRTILLLAEQGLGDTLHFVRYAPLVKAKGGRVVVQCQGALIPLLSRTEGIDELVPWGAPSPACDVWLPMMSLPGVFGTTLESVPARVPYLAADPVRLDRWRKELATIPGFRVGIAWQGSPRHPLDRSRSVPLRFFEPLARIPGVSLVSLQKGLGSEQLKGLPWDVTIHELGDDLDKEGAFLDTAAVIQNLDLVITIDTSVAHLAGGLGTPVWIVLHRTPDWRWLLERTDSPWYPSVRLFRQVELGAWEPVFRHVAEELRAKVEGRAGGVSPLMSAESPSIRGLTSPAHQAGALLVEVSAGELLDKLTILRIKAERIDDPKKVANVDRERETLAVVWATMPSSSAVDELERELRRVNEQLWDIEDAIREHEHRQDFGPSFIQLARSVYLTNDRRAELKRQVNALLSSRLVEEKSYKEYVVKEG